MNDMTTNNVATYLAFANLQMAAEADLFSVINLEGKELSDQLIVGNKRSSVFTQPLADAFAKEWKVVACQPNTGTGFSGTVFEYIGSDDSARGLKKGMNVLSFRSTEFLDDAARDNEATNVLEVSEGGWAVGQIADMDNWYKSLSHHGASRRIPNTSIASMKDSAVRSIRKR